MTKLRKTASAALVVAILAGSGVFAATANASPLTRVAPVATEVQGADVVKVGYHGHRRHHGWRRHGWDYGYGYGCFWVKKRFWDDYYGDYFYKRVRICR